MMGWCGPSARVRETIMAQADRTEDGGVMMRGLDIWSFMGAGEELLIGETVEICQNGTWVPLIPLLTGGIVVTVIA